MRMLGYLAVLAVLGALGTRGRAHAGDALADPTRPLGAVAAGATAAEPGAMRVQAIVIRPGSRVAVVDGRLVHAGDHIAHVLIEEVTPEGVRYSQDGHSRFARLQCPTPLTVRRGAPAPREQP